MLKYICYMTNKYISNFAKRISVSLVGNVYKIDFTNKNGIHFCKIHVDVLPNDMTDVSSWIYTIKAQKDHENCGTIVSGTDVEQLLISLIKEMNTIGICDVCKYYKNDVVEQICEQCCLREMLRV